MELSTAIRLISPGIAQTGLPQVWADLGAGSGLFTSALATLVPAGSTVYAMDKSRSALRSVSESDRVEVVRLEKDFEKESLGWTMLDGVLMANALHFVKDQPSFLRRLKACLKPEGSLILIEYDLKIGTPWVPYPVSRERLEFWKDELKLKVEHLGSEKSRFNASHMYSVRIRFDEKNV